MYAMYLVKDLSYPIFPGYISLREMDKWGYTFALFGLMGVI